MKNNCSNCGTPGHYSKNCPERNHIPMSRQQKLFVGHVGDDCVYMVQEQKQAHKAPRHTNRDWHLDTSLSDNSNNNMNMEEDSDSSDTTHVTSNNTIVNNNNNNIVSRDVDDTEEYEPTDPENFEAKSPKLHHGPTITWLITRC
jgi:Zinc knuckle